MVLEPRSQRQLQVTESHLMGMRTALIPKNDALLIDEAQIDQVVMTTGDHYIWHVEPGAAYRESRINRLRMDQGEVPSHSRLAHGVLGLIYALRQAHIERPTDPILGLRDVRYLVPIYEGARIRVEIQQTAGGDATFTVLTDQLDPPAAITGEMVAGILPNSSGDNVEPFTSHAEQQLFALEQCIGLVSALIGLWVLESGMRVLYMGQSLQLHAPVAIGDLLEARSEIIDRQPAKRMGERITTKIDVSATGKGISRSVASGESMFLLNEVGA